MIQIREVIVVEGKYDKIKLSSLVDGLIIETNGFGIFKDQERLDLIRSLADKRGIIILTDSDSAGFLIRGKLSSCISPEKIKHAYIPDILGKERRKSSPSREGKLGVEGVETKILLEALQRAGATLEEKRPRREAVSKSDLYELGLVGREESAVKRKRLLKELRLPEHLSANGLLRVINTMYSREEWKKLFEGDPERAEASSAKEAKERKSE